MNGSKVPPHSLAYSSGGEAAAHPILEVISLSKSFGGIRALNQVGFSIKEKSIVSIIGPNGAGKSTFINVTTGIYRPDAGEIRFQGQNIAGLPAHKITHLGIGRTFQLEELFPSMTVLENAMVGCHSQSHCGMMKVGLKLPSARAEERRVREEALENLRMVGLANQALDSIFSLSLGERKLLGIARGIGMKPKLLMIDEPAGGLAAHEIDKLSDLIHKMTERGLTLIIVEHNMPFVMSISKYVVVLDYGRKIAEGTPDVVQADPKVIKAYLGEEA